MRIFLYCIYFLYTVFCMFVLLFNYIPIFHFTSGAGENSIMCLLTQRDFHFPPDFQYDLSYDGRHVLISFLYGKWG